MDINQLTTMYQQIRSNPASILLQKFNIPQNLMNDPNAILQHLLNSGQVSQGQVNNVMQMRDNPMIQQIMSKK